LAQSVKLLVCNRSLLVVAVQGCIYNVANELGRSVPADHQQRVPASLNRTESARLVDCCGCGRAFLAIWGYRRRQARRGRVEAWRSSDSVSIPGDNELFGVNISFIDGRKYKWYSNFQFKQPKKILLHYLPSHCLFDLRRSLLRVAITSPLGDLQTDKHLVRFCFVWAQCKDHHNHVLENSRKWPTAHTSLVTPCRTGLMVCICIAHGGLVGSWIVPTSIDWAFMCCSVPNSEWEGAEPTPRKQKSWSWTEK
jgi:hypothetical protein